MPRFAAFYVVPVGYMWGAAMNHYTLHNRMQHRTSCAHDFRRFSEPIHLVHQPTYHRSSCRCVFRECGDLLHRVDHGTPHHRVCRHGLRCCGETVHLAHHDAYHRSSYRHGFRGCGVSLHLAHHDAHHNGLVVWDLCEHDVAKTMAALGIERGLLLSAFLHASTRAPKGCTDEEGCRGLM